MQDSTVNKKALTEAWSILFGCPPPIGCHINFLCQAVGWQTQVQSRGGLTATERKRLLSNDINKVTSAPVGSRLIRVWQGETHQVSVVKDGYQYANKTWKSLSAIAKEITGTPWSGPVFFGIK